MGIKERHERDREAVRRAILDAARDLFVDEGYGNVSIRKIAERIEYSPAAIYGYFPSKDDIFFALADEGFWLLWPLDHERELRTPACPARASENAFWRVYQFSCDHPQYFALMFVDRSVPRVSREYERFASAGALKVEMTALVQECIDSGDLPASLPVSVAFRLLTVGLARGRDHAAVRSDRRRRTSRRAGPRRARRHHRGTSFTRHASIAVARVSARTSRGRAHPLIQEQSCPASSFISHFALIMAQRRARRVAARPARHAGAEPAPRRCSRSPRSPPANSPSPASSARPEV